MNGYDEGSARRKLQSKSVYGDEMRKDFLRRTFLKNLEIHLHLGETVSLTLVKWEKLPFYGMLETNIS